MAGEANPRQVLFYAESGGREPFPEWLWGLRDVQARQRILARLRRVEQGNFGDHASVGEGVSELRLFFGPGYRVYFGEEGSDIVIILGGGDKSSQDRDIETAKERWKEYKNRERTEES